MHSMKKLILTAALIIGAIGSVNAQLYVDYGGPRNIFVQNDSSGNPLNFLSYDSKTASGSIDWLKLSDDLGLTQGSNWMIGGTATATAANSDITQVFSAAPSFKGTILVNWTNHSKGDKATKWLMSFTTKIGLAYDTYSIENPTTKVTSTTNHYEPILSETYAIMVSDHSAFALTAGWDKEDNYSTLPQTTNAAGKKVGLGTYSEFTAYPTELLYVHEVQITNSYLQKAAAAIAGGNGSNGSVTALLSPYVKYTPRDGGSPSSGVGFNLALKNYVPYADPTTKVDDHPEKDKFTIPWSFYIEADRKFGTNNYTTTGGASVIFSL